ncbi:hypothetical protein D7X94_06370 [Acutalibacter sp. 1XD8-33]|uniref:hypothetical protein n=1 Tax=Acutalibacter sp. 1XD8-33 TaxID=2320081 RepID=UPI000EA20F05|nr:hypothetical protein [Acutalibacter sp. 1XD8-33]RKJ40688.1 hypothetical protein D7X94_06370 [Acutalibacter sp. 1XD8-33]
MKRLRGLCAMAMMGVVLAVSKEALAALPNFEAVSLLTVLFTLSFGGWVVGALGVFLLLEGLLYGFGMWWIMYLYIWPLLAALTWLLRRMDRAWQWAIFSGLYGLAFGSLCSLVYLPVGGVKMMFAWVASGLPFDLLHGGGNFLLMLVLYRPLRTALGRLDRLI